MNLSSTTPGIQSSLVNTGNTSAEPSTILNQAGFSANIVEVTNDLAPAPAPDSPSTMPRQTTAYSFPVTLGRVNAQRDADHGNSRFEFHHAFPGKLDLEKLDLPVNEVLTPDFAEHIMLGEHLRFDANITSYFDKKYNAIWFNIGQSAVSIRLNDDGYITKIFAAPEGSPSLAQLYQLVNIGAMSPSFIDRLGISQIDLQQTYERLVLDDRLQRDDVCSLPKIDDYLANKTGIVLQAESQFFIPGESDINGLYTFGAKSCLILIAVCRDNTGGVQKIGLAHVDALTSDKELNEFFARMTYPADGAVEVSIISGLHKTALKVQRAIDLANANIVFAAADFQERRSDSAAVDEKGQVFYGNSSHLNQSVESKMLGNVSDVLSPLRGENKQTTLTQCRPILDLPQAQEWTYCEAPASLPSWPEWPLSSV